MGYKSRGGFPVTVCMKQDCSNRDKKCNDCYQVQGKMTEYEPLKASIKLSKSFKKTFIF